MHPQRLETIRPRDVPQVPPDQAALWKLWNWPHIAYRVDDLKAALAGEELIVDALELDEEKVSNERIGRHGSHV